MAPVRSNVFEAMPASAECGACVVGACRARVQLRLFGRGLASEWCGFARLRGFSIGSMLQLLAAGQKEESMNFSARR